jgi:hypothetical protein
MANAKAFADRRMRKLYAPSFDMGHTNTAELLTLASYVDMLLKIDSGGKLTTQF